MSNPIVNGLPLGLRFYDSEDQQCKWKYTCVKGVKHQEYQYTDNCSLPPFQVLRSPIPAAVFDLYIICVESGTEWHVNDICAPLVASITLKTVGIYDYITYSGNDYHACCAFPFTLKTLVYLRLEDGTNEWFSEEFWIDPSGVDAGDTNYRLWIAGGVRSTPDLRIWR
jgi:hypothetical protein